MDDQALKIHIERIVRPLRASATRKLRIRRELHSHLQSTFAEENVADESTALAKSLDRLGDPAKLAADLQKSVPWIESFLLSRLPIPPMERLERSSGRIMGLDSRLTLINASLLLFLSLILTQSALLLSAPFFPLPESARHKLFDHDNALWLLPTMLLPFMILVAGWRFMRRMQTHPWPSLPFLRAAALLLALLLLWDFFVIFFLTDHLPVPLEIARCLLAGGLLLLTLCFLERLVRRLQRPHDEWLSLNLAD